MLSALAVWRLMTNSNLVDCKTGRGSEVAAGRGDNGHSAADEVRHERRQVIVLALQPMVLHCHVLALDVAAFGEAVTKRSRALGSHLA